MAWYMHMQVSVLVVGHRQADIIPYLLKAYDLQSVKDFEIIYTENDTAKNETGVKVLKSLKTRIPLKRIVNYKKETLATCWNTAAGRAKGDLLILTKGSVIPDRFLIENYINANDGNHLLSGVCHNVDPDRLLMASVTEALKDYADKWQWHPLSQMVWGLDIMSRFTGKVSFLHNRPYYLVSGNNMAIPANVFKQVGGLDGSLADQCSPDWDLALKAWADGFEFRHVPGAIAFQVESKNNHIEQDEAKRKSLHIFFTRESNILGKLK